MSTLSHRKAVKRWIEKNRKRYNELERGYARKRRSKPGFKHWENVYYRYGITVGEYDTMLKAQNGVCAVCLLPPKNIRLAIDHCHRTGRIRGLLCMRCNTGIGKIERKFGNLRTPEFLLKIREYLLRPIPLGLENEQ